jgi:hypothetical protein
MCLCDAGNAGCVARQNSKKRLERRCGDSNLGRLWESTEGQLGAGRWSPVSLGELGGEAVERKGAEEVAAHAGFDLAQAAGGGFDPVKSDGRGYGGQLF